MAGSKVRSDLASIDGAGGSEAFKDLQATSAKIKMELSEQKMIF